MNVETLIGCLAPRHKYDNCDDENLKNGYPNTAGYVACPRCYLLRMARDPYMGTRTDTDIHISIKIGVHPDNHP